MSQNQTPKSPASRASKCSEHPEGEEGQEGRQSLNDPERAVEEELRSANRVLMESRDLLLGRTGTTSNTIQPPEGRTSPSGQSRTLSPSRIPTSASNRSPTSSFRETYAVEDETLKLPSPPESALGNGSRGPSPHRSREASGSRCPSSHRSPEAYVSRGPSPHRSPEAFGSRGPSSHRSPEAFGSRGPSSHRSPEAFGSRGPSSHRSPEAYGSRGPSPGATHRTTMSPEGCSVKVTPDSQIDFGHCDSREDEEPAPEYSRYSGSSPHTSSTRSGFKESSNMGGFDSDVGPPYQASMSSAAAMNRSQATSTAVMNRSQGTSAASAISATKTPRGFPCSQPLPSAQASEGAPRGGCRGQQSSPLPPRPRPVGQEAHVNMSPLHGRAPDQPGALPANSGPQPFSAHDHHHHHHHLDSPEGFPPEQDDRATAALAHLSQLRRTPSYSVCGLNQDPDFSICCPKPNRNKAVTLPEPPCLRQEDVDQLIRCETQDVESAWYLTSDERKTYKKPCPKQQKAQMTVKALVQAHQAQSGGTCPQKEYPPLEHPDPEDISPELAAAMMFSQERGIKMEECPNDTIESLFPSEPRPPFPEKIPQSSISIVDRSASDQKEMIEKSAGVPSEGVSDSAYSRTMKSKSEDVGPQTSFDVDFAIGQSKREYVLVTQKPQRVNKVQIRGGTPPPWFPGYLSAFPDDDGIQVLPSLSRIFHKAWLNSNPKNIPTSDVIVLD